MLYHLLYALSDHISALNVFRYITFRTGMAMLTGLAVCLFFGPFYISLLQKLQLGQTIRRLGPTSHQIKKGTPTMGGGLILIALVVATLLWADLTNPYVWLVLFITASYGLLGFLDDYLKIRQGEANGLRGKTKIFWQTLIAVIAGVLLIYVIDFPPTLSTPFLKSLRVDLGWFHVILIAFIVVGTSNAVNLTDGLDGLAIGPVAVAAATYLLLSYVAGHANFAEYLQIPFVQGAGELAIICGAIVTAGLGFLWFNTYPASVFMGDIGSLALGGAIGMIAVISKNELLLIIIGGIFVLEALSVIIQVVSYKLTKKRIFKMAPIHHHFELKGWEEPKIIVRFWIISIILAIIALSTLKLR
ncbi:phospho-N-acetylmuramoyl-pentapeptide-transferase [Bdellovibrionota bacterium]